MVSTNKHSVFIAVAFFILINNAMANSFSGLSTHDQNPLLIPYWVPQTIAPQSHNGFQFSSSLFITNTLHKENKINELLIIDAETYRLDLNFQYQIEHWNYQIQVPIISTSGGFLDDIIIDWHDFFGLPQGQRLSHVKDDVHFQYQTNSNDKINTRDSYDGIGDISFIASYPLKQSDSHRFDIGFGINLPSSQSNVLISNQKIDSSVWLSYFSYDMPYFATLGIINHGNDGIFEDQLKSHSVFAQTGFEFLLSENYDAQIQFDYHSAFIDTNTKALSNSLQIQIGLRLKQIDSANVSLFFSEDIKVESAPDITFGAQIDWHL